MADGQAYFFFFFAAFFLGAAFLAFFIAFIPLSTVRSVLSGDRRRQLTKKRGG